jgi:hypothetical protein
MAEILFFFLNKLIVMLGYLQFSSGSCDMLCCNTSFFLTSYYTELKPEINFTHVCKNSNHILYHFLSKSASK